MVVEGGTGLIQQWFEGDLFEGGERTSRPCNSSNVGLGGGPLRLPPQPPARKT